MSEKIERFEDLIAWQKARALTREVYRLTQNSALSKDSGLRGQIQRAAVSIMSNIAEGYERGNPGDFYRFLCIAKGSCAEVRSLFYVAWDAQYFEQEDFVRLGKQADEVGRVIGGLLVSVQLKRKRQS
jgi:four helix bundle protein